MPGQDDRSPLPPSPKPETASPRSGVPALSAAPARPPASARAAALPEPATFAMLVVQLLLLGLFTLLLKDVSFDPERTRAAIDGLARSFPTSRSMAASRQAADAAPLPPALEEVRRAWQPAVRTAAGALATASWLGAPMVQLTLPRREIFADDERLSLAAGRWLDPAVEILSRHPATALVISVGTAAHQDEGVPQPLARLYADLVARGGAGNRIALRRDPALAPEALSFALVQGPIPGLGPTGPAP